MCAAGWRGGGKDLKRTKEVVLKRGTDEKTSERIRGSGAEKEKSRKEMKGRGQKKVEPFTGGLILRDSPYLPPWILRGLHLYLCSPTFNPFTPLPFPSIALFSSLFSLCILFLWSFLPESQTFLLLFFHLLHFSFTLQLLKERFWCK